MRNVIAYVLVILLARVCYWFGTVITAFPIAGVLAKASDQIRGIIAGFLCGLGGVAASVAFSYFAFRSIEDRWVFQTVRPHPLRRGMAHKDPVPCGDPAIYGFRRVGKVD